MPHVRKAVDRRIGIAGKRYPAAVQVSALQQLGRYAACSGTRRFFHAIKFI